MGKWGKLYLKGNACCFAVLAAEGETYGGVFLVARSRGLLEARVTDLPYLWVGG